jgi:hypothetical protein
LRAVFQTPGADVVQGMRARVEHTVVFLHGFCLTGASWSRQIDYLLRRYDEHVRVIKRTSLAAVLLGLGASTPLAHADTTPILGTNAGQVIQQLQDWGYNVQLQGDPNPDPRYMTEGVKMTCVASSVNPTVTGPAGDGAFITVYVTMNCPSSTRDTSST